MPEGQALSGLLWIGLFAAAGLILLFFLIFILKQYQRCPSNRILVIYGQVGGQKAAKCLHGGGAFVIPLIQAHEFLSLEPLVIEIPLEGALSLNNIRVNVPSTFTVGISTDPVLMNNAAERLLMLKENTIREQAQDIILGQLRLVIATLSIEEINKDREKFMTLVNENVAEEINKIGLELINVNIRDITDESGYIQAIGKRAAAEAINRAKVEVAQQEREGAIGEAEAFRQREVRVAEENAKAEEGRKQADRGQRLALAKFEADAITGEAESQRNHEIATADRAAETAIARKNAEQSQRVQTAKAESLARQGENTSSAEVAESDAKLAEVRAEAQRRSDVARAEAARAILEKEREQELARLSKEIIAPEEILARYNAEAEGVRKVLEAKADGYRKLVEACAENPQIAPTLLLIEQLPELIKEQVKAIANLKIDKITVWDGGRQSAGGKGSTSDFLSGLIGALPPMHELASQAGIELPGVLGQVKHGQPEPAGSSPPPAAAARESQS
jgi:flotillin